MTGDRESSPGPDTRVPVLDGVRGLAIWLVMFVHFTPDYLMPNRFWEWVKKLAGSGWMGVDLFFVLSGMLITDVLLRSRGTAHAARNFYARRFLRIMPLYLGSLVFTFGILPWIVPRGVDPSYDTMQTVQGWYWVHCANVVAFLYGFPAMMSNTVRLSHFWSLAVEEHFYLLWPFLVWKLDERKLLWVAVAVVVSALIVRLVAIGLLEGYRLNGALYQTPARMDSLAFGTLVALLLRRYDISQLRSFAYPCLAVTGTIIAIDFVLQKGLWINSTFIRSIGFTLVALACSSLMILLRTGSSRSVPVRLVDNPFLRFFGKYSYGLYVLHDLLVNPFFTRRFPDDRFLTEFHGPVLATVICVLAKVAVSLAVALLSWHLIEQPCLRLKHRFEYAKTA